MSTTSASPRASTDGAARVHQQPERRTHLRQLPGGEARALEQRPGLEGQDFGKEAARVQLTDHAEGRAPLDRSKSAGVADCHDPCRFAAGERHDDVRAAGGHRSTRGNVLIAHRERLCQDRARAIGQPRKCPVHAPCQVHRGGTGSTQARRSMAHLGLVRQLRRQLAQPPSLRQRPGPALHGPPGGRSHR